MRVTLLLAALAGLLFAFPVQAQTPTQSGGYRIDPRRDCGGYPRLPIGMADGMCAGLVYARPAGPPNGTTVSFPRTVLALPSGDMLVVAMGAWRPGLGSVWRLTNRAGRTSGLRRLLGGLDMPHLAAIGPDGRVYVGEMNRIFRFDPDAANPASTIETVIDNLPSNQLHDDRHPLSMFIFDGDGSLILNVGAPTDQCAEPRPARDAICAEAAGPHAAAALWRYAYLGAGRWADRPTLYATGLRNSMALARHASGAIFQGENSIDIDDAGFPYDEVNRIRPGRNYGWPYCVDMATTAPAWRGTGALDCHGPEHTPPVMLLAPHSAPLSMLYYDGAMFPQLRGHMLITLHGYRAVGARIMAYAVDAAGAPVLNRGATYAVYRGAGAARLPFTGPAATGLNLTPNWNAVRGLRPFGRPVGITVAADGALWVADDRNGTIIRIAADR